ncbi:MAG: metal-dependent transcriptional regulator [Spirochaetales bacterium]|nr:metal-dependent transcriptional regulator [Spirochaetales bacterium]
MEKELSGTVEDYLKAILNESFNSQAEYVSMTLLANRMKLTPGTVTTMAKRISSEGWIDYKPREGCRLTEEGTKQALCLLRKHCLVESFLVKTLGMNWEDVHDEAEKIEHALSDKVMKKLDEFLGLPEADPHGHPIFRSIADYKNYNPVNLLSLAQAEEGKEYTISMVPEKNEHRPLLEYLRQHNLLPGTKIFIKNKNTGGGLIEIQTSEKDSIQIAISMGELISLKANK